jgi:threonine dehydrogenase-like Zn-dependent dehydrogenase
MVVHDRCTAEDFTGKLAAFECGFGGIDLGQQAECARFIVDKKLPLKKLLTHRFKLDEADAAYKLFDTQTTGKGVFVF